MNSAVQSQRSGTYERAQLLLPGPAKVRARQTETLPTRLLVISDDGQRLGSWRNALRGQPCEITGLANPQSLPQAHPREYDLAVVDVAAPQLARVLEAIRQEYRQIPVFVEASRLPHDLSCAGVLPRYRAMPCVRADLLHLINRYGKPADKLVPLRGLL